MAEASIPDSTTEQGRVAATTSAIAAHLATMSMTLQACQLPVAGLTVAAGLVNVTLPRSLANTAEQADRDIAADLMAWSRALAPAARCWSLYRSTHGGCTMQLQGKVADLDVTVICSRLPEAGPLAALVPADTTPYHDVVVDEETVLTAVGFGLPCEAEMQDVVRRSQAARVELRAVSGEAAAMLPESVRARLVAAVHDVVGDVAEYAVAAESVATP